MQKFPYSGRSMYERNRPSPPKPIVRRLMLRHGLSESSARSLALMVYGDRRDG